MVTFQIWVNLSLIFYFNYMFQKKRLDMKRYMRTQFLY